MCCHKCCFVSFPWQAYSRCAAFANYVTQQSTCQILKLFCASAAIPPLNLCSHLQSEKGRPSLTSTELVWFKDRLLAPRRHLLQKFFVVVFSFDVFTSAFRAFSRLQDQQLLQPPFIFESIQQFTTSTSTLSAISFQISNGILYRVPVFPFNNRSLLSCQVDNYQILCAN